MKTRTDSSNITPAAPRSAQPEIQRADLLFREVRLADAVVLVAQLERLPGANRVASFASGQWTTEDETSFLFAHDTPVDLRVGSMTDLKYVEYHDEFYLPAFDGVEGRGSSYITITFRQEGA